MSIFVQKCQICVENEKPDCMVLWLKFIFLDEIKVLLKSDTTMILLSAEGFIKLVRCIQWQVIQVRIYQEYRPVIICSFIYTSLLLVLIESANWQHICVTFGNSLVLRFSRSTLTGSDQNAIFMKSNFFIVNGTLCTATSNLSDKTRFL